MLKKLASGVLASLRGSTYRSVRLASSLVAALLDNLFEHPEANVTSALFSRFQQSLRYKPSFSGAC
jgi:CHASE1-domain containing sensor protein